MSPKATRGISIKVVVVTMFERGEDLGDTPGEFQLWVEREHLDQVIPLAIGRSESRNVVAVAKLGFPSLPVATTIKKWTPRASTKTRVATASGHNWVVLAIAFEIPGVGIVLALPVMARLHRTGEGLASCARLAREMVEDDIGVDEVGHSPRPA